MVIKMGFLNLNVANMIQNNDEIIANYQEHALNLGSVCSPIWRNLLKEKEKDFQKVA